jgi:signal transduction histidine kinase
LGALAELAPWGIAIAAAALGLLAAAAGRSFDLARQLDAVAGARRGQLAVLDQADRSLAEKMDQFARFEAAERDGGEDGAPRHAGLQRVDAESAASEFQSVDLVALVQRALDSQRSHLASLPPVQLELPEDPLWLEAEPIQLEMVVVQLVRNAAAAAAAVADEAEGGGEGTIRVSLRTAGESLELCIEDDGPGIEEETVDEVFDPFVAAGRSPRSRGLGLSVVHRVVKDHGGELRLESAPGRGTRVTVLLPGPGGDSA